MRLSLAIILLNAVFCAASYAGGSTVFVFDGSRATETVGCSGEHVPSTGHGSAGSCMVDLMREQSEKKEQQGLVVFGDSDATCGTARIKVPLGELDAERGIKRAVAELIPSGLAPIGESLRAAGNELIRKVTRGGQIVLVLASPVDACGGEPAAVAKTLKEKHGITTNVIWLQQNHQYYGNPTLSREIAQAGGGWVRDCPLNSISADAFLNLPRGIQLVSFGANTEVKAKPVPAPRPTVVPQRAPAALPSKAPETKVSGPVL